MNTNLQQLSTQRWRQNITRLLDAVEKVAGYTEKKEILQTTAITMVYLLHAETAVVSTWDADRQRITPEAFHTAGDWRLPPAWFSPKAIKEHPLFQQVLSLRRSAQFNLGGMSLPLQGLKLMEAAGIQSWIAFPLCGSDHTVLGVVDVLDSRTPRFFHEDEVALGELLAKLASTTYQRAMLFHASEKKARQLSSLVHMISTISAAGSEGSIAEVLEYIARVFAEVVRADFCMVSACQPGKDTLKRLSHYEGSRDALTPRVLASQAQQPDPLVRVVLQKNTARLVSDDDPGLPPFTKERLIELGIRSLLYVPLLQEGKAVGLIELMYAARSQPISQDDLELLQVLATHTVFAMNQARKQKAQQRGRRFSEALVEASRFLNKSLNMSDVLGRILEQTISVLACKSANLMMIEGDSARVVEHLGYEDRPEALASIMNTELPLATATLAEILELKKPVIIEKTSQRPDWVLVPGNEWIRSYVGAPLLDGEAVIGFLNLDSDEPGFFTDEVTLPLEAFASIAASVLRNAQRYQTVQDRASELEMVRQATLSLTASLNLEDVLVTILMQSLDLFTGVRDGHIFLYNEGRLHFGAAMFGDGTKGEIWAEPREDGLTYSVARTGLPIIVDDMRSHPLFHNTPDDWAGSIAGLPLKYGEMVVGVMNIAHRDPHQFQDHQIRVLGLLADQAAISIVNARLHHLVQEQSLTDTLTGLNNRRGFNNRLKEEVQRSERYGRSFSLAMMDLNGFKHINDTYGHPVGDQVLIRIGQCFRNNIRNTDFLSRYGGDEFALIMPETTMARAIEITSRLESVIETDDYGLPYDPVFPVTISIGVAQYPDDAAGEKDLIAAADHALYQAKGRWREMKA